MLYPLDHPCFSTHKLVRIHCDLTLIYPVGGGGQFIITQLGSAHQHAFSTNEYRADDKLWLSWEQLLTGFDADGSAIVEHDDLCGIAGDWARHYCRPRQHIKHAAHHQLPWLTSKLYDFSTAELVNITWREETSWLLAVLSYYKIQRAQPSEPYVIAGLLNHAHERLSRRFTRQEYDMAMHKLHSQDRSLDLWGTLGSWTYFIDCIGDDRDPADTTQWHAYTVRQVCQKLDSINRRPMQPYHEKLVAEINQYCLAWLDIDYETLFFDLAIPTTSMLHAIQLQNIVAYSRRNLKIAAAVAAWMPPEMHDIWQTEIGRLQARLDMACIRHGL